eukprot:225416-Prorocentrum_minimum.AAC.1
MTCREGEYTSSRWRHDKRHDGAVELIAQAITHGYRGSAKVLRDAAQSTSQVRRTRVGDAVGTQP